MRHCICIRCPAWSCTCATHYFRHSRISVRCTRLARYASIVKPATTPGRPAIWTRRLLGCGLAAGPVFVTAFAAEGAARDGYRPLRHPVSSLALGPGGWVQAANFAVTGIMFLAAAAGLSRADDAATGTRAGPALIGAAGAGLIGAAIFPTDPVSGYPPGTPGRLRAPTRAGTVHNLAAIPVFLGLPAAAAGASWRSFRTGQRGWGLYCAGTAITMSAAIHARHPHRRPPRVGRVSAHETRH
jgi:hypothetical protein